MLLACACLWLLTGPGVGHAEDRFIENVELHYIVSGERVNFFDPAKQDVITAHLAGVEAPPPVKRGSNVEDFASQSRDWLAHRLKPVFGQNAQLKIQDCGDVDQVRQVILYMGDSSVSINEQIVSLGLAIHQETGIAGLSDFDKRVENAERHALMFRKGVWDVAKQSAQEVVVNIAQGKKLKKDESFFTYMGYHGAAVYEVRLVFRDVRGDKIIFSEVALGRNADSKQFQNEVEIAVNDRMGIWEYKEYGRDNDRPKKFVFGVMNSRVWLCSTGEAKRQVRVVKPGEPSSNDKNKDNPGGNKLSF